MLEIFKLGQFHTLTLNSNKMFTKLGKTIGTSLHTVESWLSEEERAGQAIVLQKPHPLYS